MKLLTPYNTKAITNNLKLVFKSGDITKLNKPTYNFIMQQSGFIAHYNLYGFQDYYSNLKELAFDIIQSVRSTKPDYWSTQWFIDQYGQAYCNSKTETLKAIAEIAENNL